MVDRGARLSQARMRAYAAGVAVAGIGYGAYVLGAHRTKRPSAASAQVPARPLDVRLGTRC